MRIEDVMVTEVETIEPSATLVDAAHRMRDANVGMLPIVEGGRVSGVITDRDIVVRAVARDVNPASVRVADCATSEPVCAQPDWDLEHAMTVMADRQIGRLPVVDAAGTLVGVVTLSSLALRSHEREETLDAAQEVARRSARA